MWLLLPGLVRLDIGHWGRSDLSGVVAVEEGFGVVSTGKLSK